MDAVPARQAVGVDSQRLPVAATPAAVKPSRNVVAIASRARTQAAPPPAEAAIPLEDSGTYARF